MKTPKRKHCDIYKCDKCGGYGITYNADDTTLALYQCSLCGAQWHMPFLPKRTRAIRARYKRKNREARLRHKMHVLHDDVKYNMECVRFWRKKCKRSLEYQETSTYGQDIEGS